MNFFKKVLDFLNFCVIIKISPRYLDILNRWVIKLDKNIPLHEKLRILRAKNNITQDVAAEELHISRTCLSNYERGSRVPDVETLIAMAEYYKAEPGYLFQNKKTEHKAAKCSETSGSDSYKANGVWHNLNDNINISQMPLSSKIALHSFYKYLNYCDNRMKKKDRENENYGRK